MGATGVYVAFDAEQKQSPLIDSAAEKALWLAVERGMRVVFWQFGQSLEEAIAAGLQKQPAAPRKTPAAKTEPAAPKASPKASPKTPRTRTTKPAVTS